MKVNKQLARDAKKKGICEEWYDRLIDTKEKDKLIKMYLEGIDFCLSNEYPSNEFIRRHFGSLRRIPRPSYYGRKLPARSSPWALRGYSHLRRLERRAGIRKAPKPVKGSCYR